MSLELISPIMHELEELQISSVVNSIAESGFELVYQSNGRSINGFIKSGSSYIKNQPPLFELIFQLDSIGLAVYGDLNDLSQIRELVSSIFSSKNIDIDLQEE